VVDGATEAVIIHHAQPDRCVATCRALLEQRPDLSITVVDNGSDPEHRERIRSMVPGVRILTTGQNLGFGPAANVGLRRWLAEETGEWVLVAAHDALPRPGCLDRLMAVADPIRRAGLACAEYGDQTRPLMDEYLGGMVVALGGIGPWVPTTHPHGTLLALRRPCLEMVGLFDERYFAYVEEADLALRAAKVGWEAGMVVGAVVDNPGTAVARPVVEYLQTRNTLLLVREHFGLYRGCVRLVIATLSTLYQWTMPSRRQPWFDGRARLYAVRDRLLGRFGAPPAALLEPSDA
jgi:N-acetylglucosaminyl-diphospho-decaprenol L-rhamnosyltransferase